MEEKYVLRFNVSVDAILLCVIRVIRRAFMDLLQAFGKASTLRGYPFDKFGRSFWLALLPVVFEVAYGPWE